MKSTLLFFFLSLHLLFQDTPPKQNKEKKPQINWTWGGKSVTYKELRDSMKVFYLNYCDSVSKSKIIRIP